MLTIKKILFTFFLLSLNFLLCFEASATHIRAGDLSVRRIGNSSLEYEITVFLYRDFEGIPAQAGEISFGTGDSESVNPQSQGFINDGTTEVLLYQTTYIFPSPGWYDISYLESNRNDNVLNMDFSGATPFYIESSFLINPILGLNSSPVLLIAPVDKAAIGQRFIHNPGAFDAEGDSLAYRMTICKQGKDTDVENYRFPNNPNENWTEMTEDGDTPGQFYIDPITGDLVWDAPSEAGEYNVAFFVDEFRDGEIISSVNRDMQIVVEDYDNERPELIIPNDTCIVVGDILLDTIYAIDPDSDRVTLSLETIVPPNDEPDFRVLGLQPPNGYEEGVFTWSPSCGAVRELPYEFTFKAKDERQGGRNIAELVDLKTWRVTVVGPPPQNLNAELDEGLPQITLTWDDYTCENAETMVIYRKKGSFEFDPVCETGIPDYTGYEYLGEVPIDETTYIDQDLERGTNYCYRIYAVFRGPQGGESISSTEVCSFVPDLFYMTNVTVDETDTNSGQITIRWTQPDPELVDDYNVITYDLYRTTQSNLGTMTLIEDNISESDTTYIDQILNTTQEDYAYQVTLKGDGDSISSSILTTQVRLGAAPSSESITINWKADVPWNLTSTYLHYVYRKLATEDESDYQLIDSVSTQTSGLSYTDTGAEPFTLEELTEYNYVVQTFGSYEVPLIREPLENWSQEIITSLLDTIPPCPPVLTLDLLNCDLLPQIGDISPTEDCISDSFENRTSWVNNPDENCTEPVAYYKLYYSPRPSDSKEDYILLDSLTDLSFIHSDLVSVAGCYAVTALDVNGNESDFSNIECQDTCPLFELPNAFSPNNDGINDFFTPMKCPRFVKEVDFKVFNRWGELMYENNEDPLINWDGTNTNGNPVSPGVYYYEAEVSFYRLEESQETERFKGWIQVLTNEVKNAPK
ncbi:T9SS type B sorting domain-containing protein [Sediminitomix flava]|uniref:Gliding motility-associated-like protein n=1 Tax=Sediminitomix flava TaxID=379075 RepID=A0A315ZCK9_SEDFL|nr:gliding motility-associated C-terminal domain-containing protein [Sediminitomix flava]PWJ42849.1 gliding motility-associated-like protein [Sediminitomix flava]